jgi:hypothetical protein
VGIGTTSPGYKLVTSQASGDLITSMQGAVKTWNFRNQADGTFGYFDDSLGYWRYYYDTSNNHIWFTGASAERMRLDSSGNLFVGGTTQNTATKPVYASTTAKAWVSFNSSGGINSSFNVSSVTRTSTGNFEVNFSSAMPNSNYAATANSWQSVSNSNVSYNVFNFTTAKYQITTFENGAGTNPNATYSIVFAT